MALPGEALDSGFTVPTGAKPYPEGRTYRTRRGDGSSKRWTASTKRGIRAAKDGHTAYIG